MKKITFAALMLLISSTGFTQDNDPILTSKKLGLVSYLTYVKSIAEYKMISLAIDIQYKDEKFKNRVSSFNSAYNLLRLSVDKFINQLSADLFADNKLKSYKKINAYVKNASSLPSEYSAYGELIKKIDDELTSLLIKTFKSTQGGISLADITGVVELVHGMITDARDARQKKIESLTGLLKELKLAKLADITKPDEETKEKKDDKTK